jgi:DNA-directed RNA polymerase specialized sigma24 family protein
MTLRSELDLARLAARGDGAALDALARHVHPILRSHARRCLARKRAGAFDLDDAVDEVVAEVQAFLVAGCGGRPGWRRFDARRAAGQLEAWLFGIVRNKARRRLRDVRRWGPVGLSPHARQDDVGRCAPADVVGRFDAGSPERAVDAARALRLVGALPARERAALSLWLDEAPSREIAARLRFASAHAVDCCLARGKARLRQMMLESEPRAAA